MLKTIKIVVYTCNYGNYDKRASHSDQTIPFDWFCFTDDKEWNTLPDKCKVILDTTTDPSQASTMRAKYVRCFPFSFPELQGYDFVIYLDANIKMQQPDFIENLLKTTKLYTTPLTVYTHPDRQCLYVEGKYCTNIEKYNTTIDLNAQMRYYESQGCPKNYGFYFSGILIYNCKFKKELIGFQEKWFDEIKKFHLSSHPYPQCQMCLAFTLWIENFPFFVLPVRDVVGRLNVAYDKLHVNTNANLRVSKHCNQKNDQEVPTLAALIVEPRIHFALEFVIHNVMNVCPGIHVYFMCGKGLTKYWLKRLPKDSNVTLLELGVNNLDGDAYSNLLKSENVWQQMKEDKILVFQTDSILCKNSPYKIQDFFHYDYVGSDVQNPWWWVKQTPWVQKYEYRCFNGGLSLRTRKAMLECIRQFPPLPSKNFMSLPSNDFREFAEDVYFPCCLHFLGYNVGVDVFATNFSTQQVFQCKTFGAHLFYRFMDPIQFLAYCPEAKYILPSERMVEKNVIYLKSKDLQVVLYGVEDHNINVTSLLCVNNAEHEMIIPSGDLNRAKLFGDPVPGILKYITIMDEKGESTIYSDQEKIIISVH